MGGRCTRCLSRAHQRFVPVSAVGWPNDVARGACSGTPMPHGDVVDPQATPNSRVPCASCLQRVSVPTPAGRPDSCAAAAAPPPALSNTPANSPPPTSSPPPSIPITPDDGPAPPSFAEQPAPPSGPGNAALAVLCPPVRLPSPLYQMRAAGAAVSGGGDSSGGNVPVTADDGSMGAGNSTHGGGSARDSTQQQPQAVAAVTLGGMWLSGNGSTVYMCVESLPDDGR